MFGGFRLTDSMNVKFKTNLLVKTRPQDDSNGDNCFLGITVLSLGIRMLTLAEEKL
jgi:hypothetical protein